MEIKISCIFENCSFHVNYQINFFFFQWKLEIYRAMIQVSRHTTQICTLNEGRYADIHPMEKWVYSGYSDVCLHVWCKSKKKNNRALISFPLVQMVRYLSTSIYRTIFQLEKFHRVLNYWKISHTYLIRTDEIIFVQYKLFSKLNAVLFGWNVRQHVFNLPETKTGKTYHQWNKQVKFIDIFVLYVNLGL